MMTFHLVNDKSWVCRFNEINDSMSEISFRSQTWTRSCWLSLTMVSSKFWDHLAESTVWFGLTGLLWGLHLSANTVRATFYPISQAQNSIVQGIGWSRIAQNLVWITIGFPLVWFTFCSFTECVRLRKRVHSVNSKLLEFQETREQLSNTVRNHKQSQSGLCTMCCASPAIMLFLPCRHLFSCQECSRQLENCPYCKQRVHEKCRVFVMQHILHGYETSG